MARRESRKLQILIIFKSGAELRLSVDTIDAKWSYMDGNLTALDITGAVPRPLYLHLAEIASIVKLDD